MRRHRRDIAYLRWVLRSVVASSGLAVALLGLAADRTGAAEAAPFGLPGCCSTPPLNGADVGEDSAPAFTDLDGDGDLDVISGELGGLVYYFENTGTATSPIFVNRTGAANPFADHDFAQWSSPVFADADADGDLDALFGGADGQLRYFENMGSATNPLFAERTGTDNPLDGHDVGSDATPAFGDLDGDGDLDLVVGDHDGLFHYFENSGSATSPAFVERTGSTNPLFNEDAGTVATPSLGDVDGDGDLDVVSGEATGGTFLYYENTGTRTSPAFAVRTGTASPLIALSVGSGRSRPTLGDLDGDGDPDLISGAGDGTFAYFRSLAGKPVQRTGAQNPLDAQSVASRSSPTWGDLDGDGDLDLISGINDGTFAYFENTGSRTSPAIAARTGNANPLDGQAISSLVARPSLGDLDGDGDLDLVVGASDGAFRYFENTGTRTSPAFVQRTGAANPLDGLVLYTTSMPALGDLDGDGDLDIVAGSTDHRFAYYENTGGALSPAFVRRTGLANPLDGQYVSAAISRPSLGDLDGDGDLDLVSGNGSNVRYFENTGSSTAPLFVSRTSFANPFYGVTLSYGVTASFADLDDDGDADFVFGDDAGTFFYFESYIRQLPPPHVIAGLADPLADADVGALSAPALADLDRDGDPDLVAGEDSGALFYYENTGTAAVPHFLAGTGVENPLDGQDVGGNAKPALGDLDGDGDFDLLVGRETGDFAYFENTGDAEHPQFAAPVSNPFGLHGVGSDSAPALGDLDGDGDLDLVTGDYYGGFTYFENTGDANGPAFIQRFGAANPFNGSGVAYYSTPALADFDSDGDLDLVTGTEHGRLFLLRNTGTAISPKFVLLTSPSPTVLAGIDVGDRSAPAAADLNGDGTPDLVTGSLAGTFAVHYLPEPARAVLLGAGAALLGWLTRIRRRRMREGPRGPSL